MGDFPQKEILHTLSAGPQGMGSEHLHLYFELLSRTLKSSFNYWKAINISLTCSRRYTDPQCEFCSLLPPFFTPGRLCRRKHILSEDLLTTYLYYKCLCYEAKMCPAGCNCCTLHGSRYQWIQSAPKHSMSEATPFAWHSAKDG